MQIYSASTEESKTGCRMEVKQVKKKPKNKPKIERCKKCWGDKYIGEPCPYCKNK
jgi:hypothetical protein